jgi:hypothetical protein
MLCSPIQKLAVDIDGMQLPTNPLPSIKKTLASFKIQNFESEKRQENLIIIFIL